MSRLKNHCKLDFSADGVYLNILLDEFHAYACIVPSYKANKVPFLEISLLHTVHTKQEIS